MIDVIGWTLTIVLVTLDVIFTLWSDYGRCDR